MPAKGSRKPTVTVVCETCGLVRHVQPSWASKRFCSIACKAESQRRKDWTPTKEDIARFWERVDRSGGPDACWHWTASTYIGGYGQARWCGKNEPAHRVAYFITHGSMPEHDGCHTCDNPPCCNPAHIFDGTRLDNMADMRRKGRSAFGEKSGQSILTEKQVRQILAECVPGSQTHGYAALAARLGVSKSTIHVIFRRRVWKHLSVPD